MGSIICAMRGGEGSRAVQMAAIQRAATSGYRLLFLYIIDAARLDELDGTMQPSARAELYWMAKTLLRIAEQRAHNAGVKAELVIREGRLQDEIAKIVMDAEATTLLLGTPRGRSASAFGGSEIDNFAQSIEKSTGIRVEIVRPAMSPTAVDGTAPRAATRIVNS
jgi:hypothetical protein